MDNPHNFDKATQDQIAAVMLVFGTNEQQKEVLSYVSVPQPKKTKLEKHWLYGEQMEGFLPCPFLGTLPYIDITIDDYHGHSKVYARAISTDGFLEVRVSATASTEWGYTLEQCEERVLEDVKRKWNARAK